MTGYKNLRCELKKAGLNDNQINSKAVDVMITVMAEGFKTKEERIDVYMGLLNAHKAALNAHQAAIKESKNDWQRAKNNLRNLQDTLYEVKKAYEEILSFYAEISATETAAGRDRLRFAKYYESKCNINTCYDNTAYIKGLAEILTAETVPESIVKSYNDTDVKEKAEAIPKKLEKIQRSLDFIADRL